MSGKLINAELLPHRYGFAFALHLGNGARKVADHNTDAGFDPISYVAKIKKDQVLKYKIVPEPGLGFPAKSLGEHILAIVNLIEASARDVGDADVKSTVCELSLENGEITIGLLLTHAVRGQFFEKAANFQSPDEEPQRGDTDGAEQRTPA